MRLSRPTTLPTLASIAAALLVAAPVRAADAPVLHIVGLSASASQEVTKDTLSVTFTTTREATDAATVQTALKQALDAALAQAKKVAKPGQIEVQTGNFSVFPRYAPKGGINGWQGTAELVVEGKDVTGIAQLTSRITTLSIARVGSVLSKEQRERLESEIAAQAIAAYRAKAADYAKQFGYSGYTIREVNIGSNEPVPYAAMPMVRKAAMSSADEALPVELGKGTVTVTVNGTVQMK